ncbi:replicative DNA helicase [Streptomyces sp. NPDC006784]|uniref:replicative DNA helicase n=1 Tax=Streptomyces sp. NPDC006784 TaxID=3364764 RepID=UPI0036C35734
MTAEPYDDPASMERVPPNNSLAEQCVLGGMMTSRRAIDEALNILADTPQPFYSPAAERVFDTILALYANGQPVDPLTVTDALRKAGALDKIGGAGAVHRCLNAVPTAANTGYYAEILRDLALLRKIIETGTELVSLGYNATSSTDRAAETLDLAAAKLHALTRVGKGPESREWTLDKVVDDVMTDYDHPAGDNLPLPLKDLAAAAPMERGDLVVIAARPGMGKTVALMEIARHVAIKHSSGALVASMEMGHRQIGQRILAAEARVDLHKIRARQLDADERRRVDEAAGRIYAAPLRIDDTPAVPVSRWRTRLRQLQAENKLPAALLVDYLQIAKAEAVRGTNRTGEVDHIAAGLKALAMEFEIVVIAAAQLNRAVEQRVDKKPTLADLRESGGIENNANVVILLHREDYYDKTSVRSGEIDFIVAKNRMGVTCQVTAAWRGWQSRIVDMARTNQ